MVTAKLATKRVMIAWATIGSLTRSSAFLFRGGQACTRTNCRPLSKHSDRSISISNSRSISGSGSCAICFVGGIEYSDFVDDDEGGDDSGKQRKLTASLPTSNEFSTPGEIVSMCMTSLQGAETERAGLEMCYNFSSDSCRMANGGSLESFLRYANNPTFQSMVRCDRWELVNVGPEIPGTNTRGAMRTVLVHVVPRQTETQHGTSTGAGQQQQQQRKERKFLWTFVKERRPPRQGHFLVHECIAVDNSFAHTL